MLATVEGWIDRFWPFFLQNVFFICIKKPQKKFGCFLGGFTTSNATIFSDGGPMSELRSKCQNWGAERSADWGYCNEIIYAMIIDHPMLKLRSRCNNRGANVRIEVYCASLLFWWSLIIAHIYKSKFSLCSSFLTFAPQFWHLAKPVKNDQFWRPKN